MFPLNQAPWSRDGEEPWRRWAAHAQAWHGETLVLPITGYHHGKPIQRFGFFDKPSTYFLLGIRNNSEWSIITTKVKSSQQTPIPPRLAPGFGNLKSRKTQFQYKNEFTMKKFTTAALPIGLQPVKIIHHPRWSLGLVPSNYGPPFLKKPQNKYVEDQTMV